MDLDDIYLVIDRFHGNLTCSITGQTMSLNILELTEVSLDVKSNGTSIYSKIISSIFLFQEMVTVSVSNKLVTVSNKPQKNVKTIYFEYYEWISILLTSTCLSNDRMIANHNSLWKILLKIIFQTTITRICMEITSYWLQEVQTRPCTH